MRKEYKDGSLFLISLDAEGKAQTCGYWFLVQHGCYSHTAFRTLQGLTRFMNERGLSFTDSVPVEGQRGYQALGGGYIDEMHYTPGELAEWHKLKGVQTKVLSNGDYTQGIITDEGGTKVVHYLNPNCTRVKFDHIQAAKEMM